MRILYWGEGAEAFMASLNAALGSEAAGASLRRETTVDGLRRALADEHASVACPVVVLAPTGAEALEELRPLRSLISGLALIVLLPSDTPEAVQAAHTLRPRFVGAAEGGLADAALVVANILRHEKKRARTVHERR